MLYMRFNGSTVREPWLIREPGGRRGAGPRFNGSTVREPWLMRNRAAIQAEPSGLQWVHGSRTVVNFQQIMD